MNIYLIEVFWNKTFKQVGFKGGTLQPFKWFINFFKKTFQNQTLVPISHYCHLNFLIYFSINQMSNNTYEFDDKMMNNKIKI